MGVGYVRRRPPDRYRGTQKTSKSPFGFKREAKNFVKELTPRLPSPSALDLVHGGFVVGSHHGDALGQRLCAGQTAR
jgi:hypothetical protein